MNVSILGITYHLPDRIETTEQLATENPDWEMEKLCAKSGIASRHISAPDETASDLGFRAAAKLLDRALVPCEQIDYLLYCTQSPDHYLPSGACGLQERLALGRHVGALDFNLGCSGYIYGLQLAKALIETGMARNVLLITSDTYTKYIHPRDRTVRALFGDGAAATLIGSVEGGLGRVGEFVVGTDGRGGKNLIVPSGGLRMPHSEETARETTDQADCVRSADNLYMNGAAIFTFAITVIPKLVKTLLTKAGLEGDQVDWYVYHQANKFMLEQLASRSKIPSEKMVKAYEKVGNTVSSSIPIAMQTYIDDGSIQPGQRLILVGFGVGYSWGACDVVLGDC